MIHITRSKTGYMVVAIASNGEVLSTSEVLKSKPACWKNIVATLDDCYIIRSVRVQDDTLKEPKVYVIDDAGDKYVSLSHDPEPKYIPGKNTKRKKK